MEREFQFADCRGVEHTCEWCCEWNGEECTHSSSCRVSERVECPHWTPMHINAACSFSSGGEDFIECAVCPHNMWRRTK